MNSSEYHCGDCGGNISEGALLCPTCGATLEWSDAVQDDDNSEGQAKASPQDETQQPNNLNTSEYQCADCGGKISEGDILCPTCGATLEWSDAVQDDDSETPIEQTHFVRVF